MDEHRDIAAKDGLVRTTTNESYGRFPKAGRVHRPTV
jgi:hypothetical protein